LVDNFPVVGFRKVSCEEAQKIRLVDCPPRFITCRAVRLGRPQEKNQNCVSAGKPPKRLGAMGRTMMTLERNPFLSIGTL
jgi:hypothetical protein